MNKAEDYLSGVDVKIENYKLCSVFQEHRPSQGFRESENQGT